MLTNRRSPLSRYLRLIEVGEPAPGGPGGGITWTPEQQAEIDRIMGRTRAEATRTAKAAEATALADKLGCTVEEAASRLKKLADDETAAMTEAQRLAAEAATATAAATAATAAAERDRFDAKLDRKLLAAGVGANIPADDPKRDEKLETALTRARRLLDVQPDADDAAIAAEIATVKTDVPGLFAEAVTAPGPYNGQKPPAPAKAPTTAPGGRKSLTELGAAGLANRGWAPPASAA